MLCGLPQMLRGRLLFCQNNYFIDIIAECAFGDLLDLLNSNRVFPLKVAWIFENINLICEVFFHSVFFVSVPLKYM